MDDDADAVSGDNGVFAALRVFAVVQNGLTEVLTQRRTFDDGPRGRYVTRFGCVLAEATPRSASALTASLIWLRLRSGLVGGICTIPERDTHHDSVIGQGEP